jgi:peptidoglycan/LPS O-acetylase OafA/YrhL
VNTRSPRFPLFDSLRALAALAVVAYHVAFFSGNFAGNGASRWLTQLNVGVTIFFLVSGFLLYRPFAQARFERAAPPSVVPYAVRRVLRIVPAYWLALIAIGLWLGIDAIFTGHGIVSYFGFLAIYDQSAIVDAGGIGQIWSLCIEVTFYALLPVWALVMRRVPFAGVRGFVATEAAVLAAAFAGAVVWRLLHTSFDATGHLSFDTALVTLPAYLDHFALGMALAVASVAAGTRVRVPGRALAWPLAIVAFLVLGLLSNAGGSGGELVRHELKGLVGAGLLIPAIWAVEGSLPARVLAWRPLLWVGAVSYGLYLWNPAVLGKMAGAGWNGSLGLAGYAVIGLAGSLVLAAASWYGLERWAMLLGRRLSHRRLPLPVPPEPVVEPAQQSA